MITVVLADDQQLVRSGLRMILEQAPDIEVVGEADDGVAAERTVRELRPDVAVMDIRMPGIDGIEATRRITADPSIPSRVLMLTTYDVDQHLYDAIRAGASGFFLKTAPPHQLLEAVRATATGETLVAPAITRRLIEEFVQRPPPGTEVPPQLDELTERELDVLRAIGRGLTNAQIAQALYLGEATVKTHINRVFRKLGLSDRVQAVVLAYETGLVRPGAGGADPERNHS